MRRLRVHRDYDVPAERLWSLLTDLDAWPEWGPTVRRARVENDALELGARGTVTTMVGLDLPFVITDYDEGARWGWRVAGVEATDHTVEVLGANRCRVGFGVPWPAAPYLAVCRMALVRLADLVADERY